MDEFLKQNNRVSGTFESSREISSRRAALPVRFRQGAPASGGIGWRDRRDHRKA
jgi:hypothetical protein